MRIIVKLPYDLNDMYVFWYRVYILASLLFSFVYHVVAYVAAGVMKLFVFVLNFNRIAIEVEHCGALYLILNVLVSLGKKSKIITKVYVL